MSEDELELAYQAPTILENNYQTTTGAMDKDERDRLLQTIVRLEKELAGRRDVKPPVQQLQPIPVVPAIPVPRKKKKTCAPLLQRFIVLVLGLAIVLPFIVPRIGNFIVDSWIKPTYFNVSDPSASAQSEMAAYYFVSSHGKIPAAAFLSRIHGVHKNPELYQIQSPDELLQMFDRNQSMIKAMLEILRTTSARAVSSFHVVNEVAAFDALPDLLIMDNKYSVPEKWHQYLLAWMTNSTHATTVNKKFEMHDWVLWISGVFGWKSAETRHLDRFTFLFNPKIVSTGMSTTTLDQKMSLYETSPGNRLAKRNYHNVIFVDGIVPYAANSPPGFKMEICRGLKYTGQQAWDIQGHIESSKVLLNITN